MLECYVAPGSYQEQLSDFVWLPHFVEWMSWFPAQSYQKLCPTPSVWHRKLAALSSTPALPPHCIVSLQNWSHIAIILNQTKRSKPKVTREATPYIKLCLWSKAMILEFCCQGFFTNNWESWILIVLVLIWKKKEKAIKTKQATVHKPGWRNILVANHQLSALYHWGQKFRLLCFCVCCLLFVSIIREQKFHKSVLHQQGLTTNVVFV